jgi:hypothetical protein
MRDKSIVYQRVMGGVFTGMGLVTMMMPELTLKLFIPDHHQHHVFSNGVVNPITKLAMQCFGSQASLCGILILNSHFSRHTFKVFGLCLVPYFAFDLLAYKHGLINTMGAVGDGVGNVIFSVCCWLGYQIEGSR